MASDIWLRTILIVRKETRCRHIGYSYRLTARVLLYAPSHRQDDTYHGLCYTSRGSLAGTRNSSMGPLHEGSIRRPIAPWANALPLSYIPLIRGWCTNRPRFECILYITICVERDVAQSIACPPLKRSVVGLILLSGPSCSLGYFPFQPVVHNWFIKGRGMYCSVYGKVHIKDPLLLIEKSSLCGGSGFPSKKCVNVTIWMTSNNRW